MFRLPSGLLLLGVVVDETRKQFCLFLLFFVDIALFTFRVRLPNAEAEGMCSSIGSS